MRNHKINLLLQFSTVSFVIIGALAIAISIILSARLNANIDLLRLHGNAMMSGVMIKPSDPFSILSLSRNVIALQWITLGTMGAGLLTLYVSLVSIVWRGWRTIRRQENDATHTNAKLRQVNSELGNKVKELDAARLENSMLADPSRPPSSFGFCTITHIV